MVKPRNRNISNIIKKGTEYIRREGIKKPLKKIISSGFSKAPRMAEDPTFVTPGPGAYECSLIKKRNIECTFGSRVFKNEFSFSPGPGTYLPKIESQHSFKFAMSKAKRKFSQNNTYTDKYYDLVNLYEGPKIKFAQAKRASEEKYIREPGPGSYETINYIGHLPDYASKPVK